MQISCCLAVLLSPTFTILASFGSVTIEQVWFSFYKTGFGYLHIEQGSVFFKYRTGFGCLFIKQVWFSFYRTEFGSLYIEQGLVLLI